MYLMRKGARTLRQAVLSPGLTITLAILTFSLALFLPGTSWSINQAGVENLNQDAAVGVDQQAQDLMDEQSDMQAQNYGVVNNIGPNEDPSQFDLILQVPVYGEKLYPNISHFRVSCFIGKKGGELHDGNTNFESGGINQYDSITIQPEQGSFDATFRYYFALTSDLVPSVDINFYLCRSTIYYGQGGGWNLPRPTNADSDWPAWQLFEAEESNLFSAGIIEW